MARIETRLELLERDFNVAAAGYAPLADDPEEARVWQALQGDVAAAHPLVEQHAGALARQRDKEARQALALVDDRYARINADVGRLVTLNRVGVTRALAALDRAQGELNLLVGGLALAGIVLTSSSAARR